MQSNNRQESTFRHNLSLLGSIRPEFVESIINPGPKLLGVMYAAPKEKSYLIWSQAIWADNRTIDTK
jgi:hypothetical protein